jgi:hypothetical protein
MKLIVNMDNSKFLMGNFMLQQQKKLEQETVFMKLKVNIFQGG